MSLGNLNFYDVSVDDLKDLINAEVPEGLNIEYKRDFYGSSDDDKKEALKDISSFANSFGGHLIIGMTARDGIPTELSGLQNAIPDKAIQYLENLVRDGIEPRITGIRMKAIPVDSEHFALVLRIPRSWNPPHRVRAKNVNRFYIRNSAGAHEVSVEELRSLFTLSATLHDRIIAFRRERLAILSADEGPIKIEAQGRLILHVIPLSAFSYTSALDVKQIFNHHSFFRPISSMGYNHQFNFDGVLIVRDGDKCYGYTQIFRNGIIEATKASLVREHEGMKVIPSLSFDNYIFEVLPGYLNGLRALDIPPPLVVMISLQEVYGAFLGVTNSIYDFDSRIKFNKSELLLPEIMIDDYGSEQDYQKSMKPAFDALWNAAGYAASKYFNEKDIWVGEQNNA
ncbi:MAG TPA: ATP-binding protein [Thermodesulfovibrionales bacterium]|nr:ATP-binding protein [Thermodesulfovibrionales bacterium]